ncbi:chemotaxis protein CheB [Pedobacter montanisoli]|uniref:protein-glutamate methylesterase n=1 Tax=Pedobacter montanisoli TaxID=2923277 RepID=A0ABS9ZU00_9SPHI|nr:chemotaxis protein CheB [Pedobacter montanisoli]MCJ0741793.1 chemotaxis protein CheB [Pedobacter montanisoli]
MEEITMKGKCTALIIGGSAGSLDVLLNVIPKLNVDINFPIIIVLHRKKGTDSLLTELLASKSGLRVKEVDEKEKPLPRTVYIAPSDYHLLFEKDGSFSLDYSEKVNYSRPSIDVVFQSAAEVFTQGLVCLLLSGSNADGVNGLEQVRAYGGEVWAQNPDSATVPYMPQQAINMVKIDKVLTIEEMIYNINALDNTA